jgi:hypothetical protein
MKVYKHVTYDPNLQTIAQVIADMDDPAWRLDMVLPVMGECVAVFEREEMLDNGAEVERIRRRIEHLEEGTAALQSMTVKPVPRGTFTDASPKNAVHLGGVGRVSSFADVVDDLAEQLDGRRVPPPRELFDRAPWSSWLHLDGVGPSS